ncbi:periplasmic-binding protein [Jeotgalicoccus coquinae]|uniref:Iron complex transport system substrate-binding protein n=1 Tax=Jeotgalicoccus coquinae TaxID=709509 RepID=A0A6V7RNA3_9STAP|nr:ABC transporter substrate-binding protein [Jeotgalicoccus coquinae]MBB6422269.1 iron complex transport system substrate-binding protein [Jeotgalicoccus coquinae]GGE17269.1 periplasmic-binding protein [Jeotgalicoccus coquinae]CAD2079135.1 putative ABC transporter solute-binding protein YclQ precursor [Jeotgalicoccus coquinae]
MEFKRLYLILTMAVILVLAACSGGSEEDTSTEEGSEETSTEESAGEETADDESSEEESADTIAYDNQFEIGTGERGEEGQGTQIDETVELPKNSDKVVIFDLGVASTFAALGLEENIMGLPKGENNASLGSTISDVYESEEDYVNLGGLKEPDYEALAALDPEIIMIHGRQSNSNVVGELEKAAPNAEIIHVAADNSSYFEDVKEMTMFIGEMYDVQDKAQELVDDLDSKLAEVNEKVAASELPMLFVQTNGGNLSFHGVGGRYDFLYNDFGFTSAGEQEESEEATDGHGNEISFEFIAETNPGLILLMDRGAAVSEGEATSSDVLENEVTSGVDAIEEDNVYELNPQNWYLNAGGYLTALAQVEEINEAVDAATAE